MSELLHVLAETRWWRHPPLLAAVCALVVAVLASGGAHLGLGRVRTERARLFVVAPALLMCAAAVLAAARQVAQVRGDTIGKALGRWWVDLDCTREELVWLALASVSALVLAPAAGAALARAVSPRGPRWLAWAATFALVATALSALGYVQGFEHALSAPPLGWIGDRPDVNATIQMRLVDLEDVLASGKAILVASGAITCVVLLALRARGGERWFRGWLSVVIAGLVFGLGAAAFAATRDDARDRDRPVRLTATRSWIDDPSAPIAALRGPCAAQSTGPALVVMRGEITLDHRTIDPRQFADDLDVYRRNWAVLRPGREPGPHELHLIAAPNARLDPLRPYFARARAGGIRTLVLQAQRTEAVRTHTLGVVDAPRGCALRVDLIEGAAPLPETFESLALEIARGRTTLEVPP